MPTLDSPAKITPLAAILRPKKLDEIIGQEHLLGPGKPLRRMLERNKFQSTIFWGPPGTGKTTIVRALAIETKNIFCPLNATEATVKDLRAVIDQAKKRKEHTFVFIDECLPYNAIVLCRIKNEEKHLPIGYLVDNSIDAEVLSVDVDTGIPSWKPIISWSVVKPKPMVEVSVDRGGESILLRCSADHLIFTTNRGYVPACQLCLDDDVCLEIDKLQEIHANDKTQNMSEM